MTMTNISEVALILLCVVGLFKIVVVPYTLKWLYAHRVLDVLLVCILLFGVISITINLTQN